MNRRFMEKENMNHLYAYTYKNYCVAIVSDQENIS